MSKLNIYIMLLLLLPAFGVLAQNPDSPTDYRRDKNWNWHSDYGLTVDIYCYAGDNDNVTLPWSHGGHNLFTFFKSGEITDVHPSDGWELLLMEFGSPDRPCHLPYILLYNKYQGILRYVYWGARKYFGGYAVATLELKSDDYTPILELSAIKGGGYTSDNTGTDRVQSISVLGGCGPVRWNVFDFDLSGYDPDIASKTVQVKISIDLYDNVLYEQDGERHYTSYNPFYHAFNSYYPMIYSDNIVKMELERFHSVSNAAIKLKDSELARKYINSWARKDSLAGKWYAAPVMEAGRRERDSGWIPSLAPYSAVIPFLKGGGFVQDYRTPRTICSVPTELKLAFYDKVGELSSIYFYLPGCKVPDPEEAARMNELPLYNKPLGIFSMEAKPQADYGYQLKELWKIDDSNLYETYYDSYLKLAGPLSFELNPYVFDQDKSTVEMSFVSEHQDISEFKSASIPEAYGEYTGQMRYVNSRSDISPDPYQLEDTIARKVFDSIKLAVLAKLVPLGKDDAYIPVQMVKAYDLGAREYVGMIDQPSANIDKGAKNVRLLNLGENYPNPFNPVTTIPFTLETSGKVKIVVHNVRGQEVETLTNRQYNAGQHHLRFDAGDLPSGLYFVRAEITGIGDASVSQIVTRKMTLVR